MITKSKNTNEYMRNSHGTDLPQCTRRTHRLISEAREEGKIIERAELSGRRIQRTAFTEYDTLSPCCAH